MIFRIVIARSQREYADVSVEAPSIEVAEAYVEHLLADDSYPTEYCNMVNAVSWNCGDESFDEEVIDAEESLDQDDEADATVPDGWTPDPAPEPEPTPAPDKQLVWVLTITHRHGDDTTVHATENGARGSLAEYCREWWAEAFGGQEEDVPVPDDDNAVIDGYFAQQGDRVDSERYELNLVEVQP